MSTTYLVQAGDFSQEFDDIHEAIQYGFDNLNDHPEWTVKTLDGFEVARALPMDRTIYVADID